MRLDEKGRESETPVAQAEDLSDWGNAGFRRKGGMSIRSAAR